MPTEKGDKKSLTVWIEKKLVGKLDVLAEKGEITRSKPRNQFGKRHITTAFTKMCVSLPLHTHL